MNQQGKSRPARGKAVPKAQPKRTANRGQRANQDLSVSFSVASCYGDMTRITFTTLNDVTVQNGLAAFVNHVVEACTTFGSAEFALLTIIRSLTVTIVQVGRDIQSFTPPNTTGRASSAFTITQGGGRARLSFSEQSYFVQACRQSFRATTNLDEPSPSWRREGIPLSLLFTARAEDILGISARRVLTFEAVVCFPRSDRAAHIGAPLRALLPADARQQAAERMFLRAVPLGAPGRALVLAGLQHPDRVGGDGVAPGVVGDGPDNAGIRVAQTPTRAPATPIRPLRGGVPVALFQEEDIL